MAAVPAVTSAAGCRGIEVVPGIEITSVHQGRDVHVLGYYVDPESPPLQEMLARHRVQRAERAREIARRLASAGAPIDVDALLAAAPANAGKALARPQIARALIAAGHVESVAEAFDRYLGESCPAYVPHTGASPLQVVELIIGAGGLASLAHPGTLNRDEIIPALCESGLTAIEAYHSAHTPAQREHYLALAAKLGVIVTGGSDFHGPNTRRSEWFGKVTLPAPDFQRFQEAAARARYELRTS
jgi:predicted metal-dependent phosphoesterase TrpH